jgi:hypothetical protein
MLAIQKQSKYINRRIQLPNGYWADVVFELVDVNGKIVAKAISGKIIGQNIVVNDEVLSLPVYFERETFKPIISPFFSETEVLIKDLCFVVTQPTRAPNF